MTEAELIKLINEIEQRKTETPNIELKRAKTGCSESLYDTLSSFSNTSGGIIIFGINEKNNYKVEGIENVDGLQKKVTEQCLAMEPPVRCLFTVVDIDDKIVCSCEIPEISSDLKPCYYKGKGKQKGSYIRIGDADLPMTDYEIYSYDAYRYKKEDELRVKERIDSSNLNNLLLDGYLSKLVNVKSNLLNIERDKLLFFEGITDKNGAPTLCGLLSFGVYPQLFSPNLDIVAVRCATDEYGVENSDGIRFTDNRRLDGTIGQMLQQAISFVTNNTFKKTYVNPNTGLREDKFEYPLKAIREVVLNALIHRDYSIHTENEPIRIIIYDNRIEVTNPGGLYGKLSIDDLGKTRGDIRNPHLAGILEILDETENRYSGIPTIYKEMADAGLPNPKFEECRGSFKVTLYNGKGYINDLSGIETKIVNYCAEPIKKEDLARQLGFDDKHPAYFVNKYVKPLIDEGILAYTIPDKPRSKNQRIIRVKK